MIPKNVRGTFSSFALTASLIGLCCLISTTTAEMPFLYDLELNIPLLKENQVLDIEYFVVKVEEKIKDLQLTVLVSGRTKESQSEVSLYILDEKGKGKDVGLEMPDLFCQLALNNVCSIPESLIKYNNGFQIVVGVHCYQRCSYVIEASYTQMREFKMNEDYTYSHAKQNPQAQEDIVSMVGWFSVPADDNIQEIILTVYEQYVNLQMIPIQILLNPGKGGIFGNTAKFISHKGILNSAILKLSKDDFSGSKEFCFEVNFASDSILFIQLDSIPFDTPKLEIGKFTQNYLAHKQKMHYILFNPNPNDHILDSKSLIIDVFSQQGQSIIKFAGSEFPKNDSDYIVTTEKSLSEQKLVISAKMRSDLGIGNSSYHLTIESVDGPLLYLLETSFEFEFLNHVTDLEFDVQTSHLVDSKSFSEFYLTAATKNPVEIGIQITSRQGSIIAAIKGCTGKLADCVVPEKDIIDIINYESHNLIGPDFITFQKANNRHNLEFQSDKVPCKTNLNYHLCTFYILVVNPSDNPLQFSILPTHSFSTTIIKESEEVYGSVRGGTYKYYTYPVPPESKEVGPIEYIKIVLAGSSIKTIIAANIQKAGSTPIRTTYDKAQISLNSDYLVIRSSEYGLLNGQQIDILVYSDEYSSYNLNLDCFVNEGTRVRSLYNDIFVTGLIESYSSREVYKTQIIKRLLNNPDAKLVLKPIEGSFTFRYCKTISPEIIVSDCKVATNNIILIPSSEMKEEIITGYVEIVPIIPPTNSIETPKNKNLLLQYRFGLFLSTSLTQITLNEPYTEFLIQGFPKFYKIQVSMGDLLRFYMTSNDETAGGANVVAYISYDKSNKYPSMEIHNATMIHGQSIYVSENTSNTACSVIHDLSALDSQCFFYISVYATKKDSQTTISVSQMKTITRLFNKIQHLDEYPNESHLYRRYYLIAEKDQQYFLETNNHLARLDIFLTFHDGDRVPVKFNTNEESQYPRKEWNDFALTSSQTPNINIIEINNKLYGSKDSECYNRKRCLIAISIRVNESDAAKNLQGEFFSIQLFTSDISLIPNTRQKYNIRENTNYFFKLSITASTKRYIIHSNPIGACDIQLTVSKMEESMTAKYSEKGGNFLVIDEANFPSLSTLEGNYLVTITTEDVLCSFYLVGYDTHYQYVKVSQGQFFQTDLAINESLFLDYEHYLTDDIFKVQASIEEGSVRMGIMEEKTDNLWTPLSPIVSYPVNNIKDLSQHSLMWGSAETPACAKCRYIIAIQAIRETRLSMVVKTATTYTALPAQRMIKFEGKTSDIEKIHFFFHSQDFDIQVTLISGSISVNGNFGPRLLTDKSNQLFDLSGIYKSKELPIQASLFQSDSDSISTHSVPYSLGITITSQKAIYIISFCSVNRMMHLAAGLPYFKTLQPSTKLDLQYKSLSGEYMANMEFSFYFTNDFYLPEGKKILEDYIIKNNLQSINFFDFYPQIHIEDQYFKSSFGACILSREAIFYTGTNTGSIYSVSVNSNSRPMLDMNISPSFYIIAHSGTQHLLNGWDIRKSALAGAQNQFEYYLQGQFDTIVELTECSGSSFLSVTSNVGDSSGFTTTRLLTRPYQAIYQIQSKTPSSTSLDYHDYMFTVASPISSKYIIKANNYLPGTIFPQTMYISGQSMQLKYQKQTQQMEVVFDGIKCEKNCNSPTFMLLNVQYIFDSDYHNSDNALGKALCSSQNKLSDHLQVIIYEINKVGMKDSPKDIQNKIDHSNITTLLAIHDLLDKQASIEKTKQFFISLNAKATFLNLQTKQQETFNFSYQTAAVDVHWIDKESSSGSHTFLYTLLGLSIAFAVGAVGYFVYKRIQKSRRNMPFEMQDALDMSTVSQPSNSLKVNLQSSIEMNKFEKQQYAEFADEEEISEPEINEKKPPISIPLD